MATEWIAGDYYRGRGVPGEITIKEIGEKRTQLVEALIEVTKGPMTGRRVKFRGYVNSEKNAEKTAEMLRAAGWRASRWGDWSGWGTKEIDFQLMLDQGKYPRAEFLREPKRLSEEGCIDEAAIERLNRKLPPPPPPSKDASSSSSARRPPPSREPSYEPEPDDLPPYDDEPEQTSFAGG